MLKIPIKKLPFKFMCDGGVLIGTGSGPFHGLLSFRHVGHGGPSNLRYDRYITVDLLEDLETEPGRNDFVWFDKEDYLSLGNKLEKANRHLVCWTYCSGISEECQKVMKAFSDAALYQYNVRQHQEGNTASEKAEAREAYWKLEAKKYCYKRDRLSMIQNYLGLEDSLFQRVFG